MALTKSNLRRLRKPVRAVRNAGMRRGSRADSFEKDFMDKLYDSYDREIRNLWQRSVFLGVFLAGVYTAYGTCWKMIFDYEGHDGLCYLHNVSLAMTAVCVVGMIVSLLWILMAKGSKAYQEVLEMKIRAFTIRFGLVEQVVGHLGNTEDLVKECIDEDGVEPYVLGRVNRKNFHGKYEWSREVDANPFSLEGGAFSTGKVNIAIGSISLCLWIVAISYHVLLLAYVYACGTQCRFSSPMNLCCGFFSMKNGLFVAFLFVSAFMLFLICSIFANLKSSSLLDKKW